MKVVDFSEMLISDRPHGIISQKTATFMVFMFLILLFMVTIKSNRRKEIETHTKFVIKKVHLFPLGYVWGHPAT
jgi:preprotein translocase subunit SecG